MNKTVDAFCELFDDWATDYDEENDNELIRTTASLVIEHAAPNATETVLDLGAGTGAIALELAAEAETVIGRDISEGMLDRARAKAHERGIENVEFGVGRFRAPNVQQADVVVSNFALHHLDESAQRDAINTLGSLGPRRVVLGHCMFFGDTDPEDPPYSKETIYPATVGVLVAALTDAGFAVTTVEEVHEHVGVLVAERQETA